MLLALWYLVALLLFLYCVCLVVELSVACCRRRLAGSAGCACGASRRSSVPAPRAVTVVVRLSASVSFTVYSKDLGDLSRCVVAGRTCCES